MKGGYVCSDWDLFVRPVNVISSDHLRVLFCTVCIGKLFGTWPAGCYKQADRLGKVTVR